MVDKIYDWKSFLPLSSRPVDINNNNYKLFSFIANYATSYYNQAELIDIWHDIDKANGKALDDIGTNFDEFRGEADDLFYRFMIKSKILSSRSKGTANDIIDVISKSLNVDKSQIVVQNDRRLTETGNFIGEPFSISISNLPLEWTANDFQKRYLIKRIEETVAEGISLSNISFSDFSHSDISISSVVSATQIINIPESIFNKNM